MVGDQIMLVDPIANSRVRWFSAHGSVEVDDGVCTVRISGALVAQFEEGDRTVRNMVLVQLAQGDEIRRGPLAEAFGITRRRLTQLRRAYEEEGLKGISARRIGRQAKVTPELRIAMERLFDRGLTAKEVHRRIRRRGKLGLRLVQGVQAEWRRGKRAAEAEADTEEGRQDEVAEEAAVETGPTQLWLDTGAEQEDGVDSEPGTVTAEPEVQTANVPPLNDLAEDGGDVEGEDELEEWRRLELHGGRVQVGEHVQHLGVWVLLAVLVQLGLYRCVMQSTARKDRPSMRVVLDALVVALALGEGCVEGVRRVATPSASRLLRARRCPSPNWARRVLGKLGEAKGDEVQWNATRELIEGVKTFAEEAVVFYVDNHARPYTGKHTVRKVWRMQDKRARPGSTDFYVHDEEGRPVWRVEVPANEPLTKWLTPIARELREAVGPEPPILLAFDRAGAFPEQLASLRNEGFHFVTYERKPYQKLASALFDTSIEVDGETYRVYERRRNLGRGRGRVWRLALRTPEDEQVNLLVMSDLSAEFLTTKMFGRWNQENGFKHGVGRWGINQLDGRKAAHYPPETIIPNPARRRLDRALRLARRREGDARSKLAAVDEDHPRRDAIERDLEDALEEQRRLLAMRPQMPTHAPLAETELAGKLVHHTGHLKQVVDVVRMMCANAEAELAALLGPHLPRAAEAKKALATLFAAPGNIRLRDGHVAISLRPAGTKAEHLAFSRLCRSLDSMDLTLPGDPSGRRLRFQIGN